MLMAQSDPLVRYLIIYLDNPAAGYYQSRCVTQWLFFITTLTTCNFTIPNICQINVSNNMNLIMKVFFSCCYVYANKNDVI